MSKLVIKCEICKVRVAAHVIQGRHVCKDKWCKFKAWDMPRKK